MSETKGDHSIDPHHHVATRRRPLPSAAVVDDANDPPTGRLQTQHQNQQQPSNNIIADMRHSSSSTRRKSMVVVLMPLACYAILSLLSQPRDMFVFKRTLLGDDDGGSIIETGNTTDSDGRHERQYRIGRNNNDENYFSGVIARPFQKWSTIAATNNNDGGAPSLPCYAAEPEWSSARVQNTPATHGFLYLKPFKTGSSTVAGVHLRIARNVAMRQQQQKQQQQQAQVQRRQASRSGSNTTSKLMIIGSTNNGNISVTPATTTMMCAARFGHGPTNFPAATLFQNRSRDGGSFLWSMIRDPTQRYISMFFHFEVSRHNVAPTDANFHRFLTKQSRRYAPTGYYLHALTTTRFNPQQLIRTMEDTRNNEHEDDTIIIALANAILEEYDFIGITERMDESVVALMMLLDVPMADILTLSAKHNGGYDAGGANNQCTYIIPSFVSSGMRTYFDTHPEWEQRIYYDTLLYQAVNRSLDLTIDALGRDIFENHLARYRTIQHNHVQPGCAATALFPCSDGGVPRPRAVTSQDCLWKDSGCGTSCLDDVASAFDLW